MYFIIIDLEPLKRIPSPLFDRHCIFPPTRGLSNPVQVPAKDVLSSRIARRVALRLP